MLNKKIYTTLLSTILVSSLSVAETEITGKFTHESARYLNDGTTQGAATSHKSDDLFKSESNIRIYADGEIGDDAGSTFHLELQGYKDGDAITSYEESEPYTQRDSLREAYVDTSYGDWAVRLGKQQTVWGTADGMKLLDNINPTDFSEMAQNQMEDSRIPVWMLNADKPLDDGGNFQIVVSQPRENIFAGLNRGISTAKRGNGTPSAVPWHSTTDGSAASLTTGNIWWRYSGDTASTATDQGNPYILKGVDSITGAKNGFTNIVPDLGTIAYLFGQSFNSRGDLAPEGLNPETHAAMNGFTVGAFNNSSYTLGTFNGMYANTSSFPNSTKSMITSGTDLTDGEYILSSATADSTWDFVDLNFGDTAFWTSTGTATGLSSATTTGSGYTGQGALQGYAGMFSTSNELLNTDSATNSVFEYMNRTPFSTFDAFVGAKSEYAYDMPDDADADIHLRYKNTTDDGINYSFNFSNAYDKNPIIDLSWHNASGALLKTCKHTSAYLTSQNSRYLTLEDGSTTCSSSTGAYGGYAGEAYRAAGSGSASDKYATLRFTQKLKRTNNLGGSFDMTLESEELGPVVIRGEAVYQQGTYSPVMDRGALSIGDLPGALTMRKGDRFKYVLGADITALTNMMISAQFIQDRNLDYIDSQVDWDGTTACSSSTTANCGVYTTDYATMHLSNGFNKAAKNKNFYSLYLSKPYGESGQHRWNNITIFEETGGYWNRLDTEYTLDDNTVLTGEVNTYWGKKDTQFGQLEDSSNVQLGVKYTF